MIVNLVRNLNLRCCLSGLSTLNTRTLTSRINLALLLSRYLLTLRQSTVDMACLCSMVYVASAEDTQNNWEWLKWQGTESWRGFWHVWQLIWDNSKAGLSWGYKLKLLHVTIWPVGLGFLTAWVAEDFFLMIQDSMSKCSSKPGGNFMLFYHVAWEVMCITSSPKSRGGDIDFTSMCLKLPHLLKV